MNNVAEVARLPECIRKDQNSVEFRYEQGRFTRGASAFEDTL
jgi:hypothetical protein